MNVRLETKSPVRQSSCEARELSLPLASTRIPSPQPNATPKAAMDTNKIQNCVTFTNANTHETPTENQLPKQPNTVCFAADNVSSGVSTTVPSQTVDPHLLEMETLKQAMPVNHHHPVAHLNPGCEIKDHGSSQVSLRSPGQQKERTENGDTNSDSALPTSSTAKSSKTSALSEETYSESYC